MSAQAGGLHWGTVATKDLALEFPMCFNMAEGAFLSDLPASGLHRFCCYSLVIGVLSNWPLPGELSCIWLHFFRVLFNFL